MSAAVTAALVPVKSPARAKTRLLGVLEPEECARLTLAMLDDVLNALADAPSIDEVYVVTGDETIAERVKSLGHRVLHETNVGLCAALDGAAAELANAGIDTVLVLPADLPTVTAHDIEDLLKRHDTGLSISPAIRDGGTNALVCSPPNAVPFCFGKDSAARHAQQAESSGIENHRLPVPAFFRDVDLPDDLAWLSGQANDTRTCEFLRHSGIGARLTSLNFGKAS